MLAELTSFYNNKNNSFVYIFETLTGASCSIVWPMLLMV